VTCRRTKREQVVALALLWSERGPVDVGAIGRACSVSEARAERWIAEAQAGVRRRSLARPDELADRILALLPGRWGDITRALEVSRFAVLWRLQWLEARGVVRREGKRKHVVWRRMEGA